VVAGDEQLGAGEAEAAEALLEGVAGGDGGVADDEQDVAARVVHPVDQLVGERPALRVVVVEVRRDQQPHRGDCSGPRDRPAPAPMPGFPAGL
jgi:hypothetical protein